MGYLIASPALKLSDVTLTTVQPHHKTAHVEFIDPTFMDLGVADCLMPVIFAYRLADKSAAAYSQAVKRIKDSLAKVLVPFFPFAGRWIAVTKGSTRRRLLCNDAGVPFVEAYIDRDLDSVVQASAAFQPVWQLQGHALVGIDLKQFKAEMPPDGLPSIFVQLTRFKCGGIVLAVTFNHIQTDGKGFFNFMTAWSDLSRTNETAVRVDHNRAQVEVPSVRALFPDQDTTTTDTVSSNGSNGVNGAADHAPFPPEKWAVKSFEASASAIKSLKKEAKRTREGFVSSGDCIVAHLWKSFAGLDERGFSVNLSVEGRARFFNPPLPNICANVYTAMLCPDIARDELLDMPAASIASRIRETLQKTRGEEWLALERIVNLLQTLTSSEIDTMTITSWVVFPMYEMDFGFGKPFFATLNNLITSNSLGGAYSLFSNARAVAYVGPPIPNSSSCAFVQLYSTPEALQAVEHNPEFSSLFCVS